VEGEEVALEDELEHELLPRAPQVALILPQELLLLLVGIVDLFDGYFSAEETHPFGAVVEGLYVLLLGHLRLLERVLALLLLLLRLLQHLHILLHHNLRLFLFVLFFVALVYVLVVVVVAVLFQIGVLHGGAFLEQILIGSHIILLEV